MKSPSFLATLLVLVLALPASAYRRGKTYRFTVLHTNDHHGAFWRSEQGEYGLAARRTLIERIRREQARKGIPVLLLSAGDVNTGVPASDMAMAEPDFRGMSRIGYDAMAVGNHEFDMKLPVILKQRDVWSNFPWLSANIYEKGRKRRPFRAHIVKDVGGLKVAILGLTTPMAHVKSIFFPHDRFELVSPIEEARQRVPELRREADVVIGLTHMGHYPDGKHPPGEPGDVTMAREVPGFDLIVGGHSQLPVWEPDVQNGTPVLQAGEWGKHLGRADVTFRNGRLDIRHYQLIPVNLRDASGALGEAEIDEDPELVQLLRPFQRRGEKVLEKVVGRTTGRFEGARGVIRNQETDLGNLVAAVMADATGAEIAIVGSGVIRTSLPAGEIRFRHVKLIHPWSLELVTVDLTGEELVEYMRAMAAFGKGSGTYPQLHGIRMSVSGPSLTDVKVGPPGAGVQPDPARRYRVALTDFHARGGDGYPRMDDHPTYRRGGITDARALRNFLAQNEPLDPADYAPREGVGDS